MFYPFAGWDEKAQDTDLCRFMREIDNILFCGNPPSQWPGWPKGQAFAFNPQPGRWQRALEKMQPRSLILGKLLT